jgi:hypothetical protein
MSHHEVDYSELEGAAKEIKALADIIDYLGQEKFNLLVEHTKTCDAGYVRGALTHVAGISGYPVTAFINHYYPKEPLV